MQTLPANAIGRRRRLRFGPRWLQAPAVVVLALWMIVPLALTLYFSLVRYNLLNPDARGFVGGENYRFLWEDAAFIPALLNTVLLIGWVVAITVALGTLLAVVFEQPFVGRRIATVLVIAPFFVMPTVSALVWKNMILHPVYGLAAGLARRAGLSPVDWFGDYPLASLILILSWEWLPFAFLVLLTSLQSLDPEQREAARIDGAGPWPMFFHIILPHLRRAIAVVVMIETIFLLSVFAEIHTTTSGGPGTATTNLAYLVYSLGLQQFDIGIASAGGIIVVALANFAAFFLVRGLARSLQARPSA